MQRGVTRQRQDSIPKFRWVWRHEELWAKVEQSGRWPQQAGTTMLLFLIQKSVTSERRPIALMCCHDSWWEDLQSPGVAKWQHKHLVEWDEMEELREQCGDFVGDGKMQLPGRRKIIAPWPWSSIWQKPSSGSVFQWCGRGRLIPIFP